MASLATCEETSTSDTSSSNRGPRRDGARGQVVNQVNCDSTHWMNCSGEVRWE